MSNFAFTSSSRVTVHDFTQSCLSYLHWEDRADSFSTNTKYVDLVDLCFESEDKGPARQRLWTWIVNCLHGPTPTAGEYHYLTRLVPLDDIAGLYGKLVSILERVSICCLDDEIYNVCHLEFNANKPDLFAYFTDLKKAIQALDDVNARLPEGARIHLNESRRHFNT